MIARRDTSPESLRWLAPLQNHRSYFNGWLVVHVCIPLLCVHGHVFVWVGVGRLECTQAAGKAPPSRDPLSLTTTATTRSLLPSLPLTHSYDSIDTLVSSLTISRVFRVIRFQSPKQWNSCVSVASSRNFLSRTNPVSSWGRSFSALRAGRMDAPRVILAYSRYSSDWRPNLTEPVFLEACVDCRWHFYDSVFLLVAFNPPFT